MTWVRLERGRNDHPGYLLDLRTLISALTGDSHSLDSACTAFQVPGKAAPPTFGVIDEAAIDYCRQDVAATTGLFEAVLREHARHPVDLPPTQAYSPASLAKAYLRQIFIIPRLTAQPEFPDQVLGWAMSAFYGGRAEVHIRHTPLPVALVDFTSMYPTVDILLDLWNLITAERVDTVDATAEVNAMLATITPEDCFQPELWREFVAIAEIVPNGDVLLVRADYCGHGQDWTIGVNPLHAEQPLWYTLPDLIASTLRSGRRPTVRQALRFVPRGRQPGLRPVRLRGDITVDPVTEDFFQTVVEARQQLRRRVPDHPHNSCLCSDCGTARFLKVLANAGSYGIYAQMDRHERATGEREKVTVHGPTDRAFRTKVAAPEDPGEFCFPPVAAVITGAGRLMLALLERLVADAGGTWMFCDTDSMAIVATDHGQLLACPGGDQRLPDGIPAVRALDSAAVEQIRGRFRALNAYEPTVVPDLLKREDTGTCYAISAKRYEIHRDDPDGGREIRKRSLHGLGRYLDPVTADEGRRDEHGNLVWIDQAWEWILAAHDNPDAPQPSWADRPAMSTVSSPTLWRPFADWNDGRGWDGQSRGRDRPCCDARSHVMSELVEEGRRMSKT